MDASPEKQPLSALESTALAHLALREEYFRRQTEMIRQQAQDPFGFLNTDPQSHLKGVGRFDIEMAGQRAAQIAQIVHGIAGPTTPLAIVNLGAGLDRLEALLDLPNTRFFHVDRPGIVRTRKQLGFDDEANTSYALELHQLGDLRPAIGERRVVFVLSGFCMYLPTDKLVDALLRMALKFPGADVVCDMVSPRGRDWMNSRLVKSPRAVPYLSSTVVFDRLSREMPRLRCLERALLPVADSARFSFWNRDSWTFWYARHIEYASVFHLRFPERGES
jgi:hypothetical protein